MEEIGKGSFALVYLGEHPKSKTFVAVKAVSLRRLSKKLKDNLKSEIGILKGLHHPHITAMIDCQETSSYIHVIMEFCALGDLSLFIKKRHHLDGNFMALEMVRKYPTPTVGGLNGVVVHHFLKQLSSALEFLRSKDLIHRDLKPQNLLLNPPPKALAEGRVQKPPYKIAENSLTPAVGVPAFPMLKIADFGFARSLPSTSLAETLCGSPLYMAPEILRYEKYDAKADLWSVGTVLYEMLVGRPPYRAANHVELLRKIERSNDKIDFPSDIDISEDMKEIIRALLKRNPVERINFKDFFASSVITGPIPGLDPADADVPVKKEDAQTSKRASLSGPERTVSEQPYPSSPKDVSSPRRLPSSRPTTPIPKGSYKALRKPSVDNTATDLQRAAVMGRQVSALNRPSPSAAPDSREAPVGAMVRYGSKDVDAPRASLIREKLDSRDRGGPERSKPIRVATESDTDKERERERAAQDVAFERDYVVVTKRQVEVNAFADELAASPSLQQKQASPRNTGAIIRRATTSAAYPTKARPSSQHIQEPPTPTTKRRTGSFDLRSGPVATSATSAISKALNMASNRLLGVSFSPPNMGFAKSGPSPPLAYNPFPHYPQVQGSLVFVGEGRKDQLVALDEDSKTAQILEDCATRSDVVYGFAEVKYKQLIPLAPSAQPNTAIRPGGISPSAGGDIDDVGTDDLPDEAVVTLSEEGLVLYVKALSLLAKTMNIAGAWWARKNRGEVTGESPPKPEGCNFAVLSRINAVVQWTRTRFNEVLQKAEYVRARLSESQKRLPQDHSSHPSNNTGAPVTGIEYGSTQHIYLSPGVTAERLIFERAVEMSKTAAINEISNTDLPGCDISYVTAIRMLEAILESDDEDETRSTKSKKTGDDGGDKSDTVNGLGEHERKEVAAVIERVRHRLVGVRAKMEHMEMMAKRASSATPTANGNSASPAALK